MTRKPVCLTMILAEFGKALTAAESEAGGGRLVLTRWRGGRTEEVTVKLPVLGTYGATAPFACPTRRPPERLRDDEFPGCALDHLARDGACSRCQRPQGFLL